MVPNCVTLMNLKARELGLTNTKFVEPSGLSVFNISNAEELVKIVEASSYYPEIVEATFPFSLFVFDSPVIPLGLTI